jgi:hypothetical protein
MTANQAIHYIRERRPKSVQMNDQIQSLTEFENYLRPLRIVFPRVSSINTNLAKLNESGDDKSIKQQQQDKLVDYTCNLHTFLNRQRLILHGAERKTLKYIPKVNMFANNPIIRVTKQKSYLKIFFYAVLKKRIYSMSALVIFIYYLLLKKQIKTRFILKISNFISKKIFLLDFYAFFGSI